MSLLHVSSLRNNNTSLSLPGITASGGDIRRPSVAAKNALRSIELDDCLRHLGFHDERLTMAARWLSSQIAALARKEVFAF
jgi:hypothetical protein